MQKNDSTTSTEILVQSDSSTKDIHELFSCEKIKSLADIHRELCMGLYSSVNGGASSDDILSLASLLVEQSEEISTLLLLKSEFAQ